MSANKRKKISKTLRHELHEKYQRKCAYCGCKIDYEQMTADHVKPLNKGGEDDISNISPSCVQCNNFKNNATLEQFRNNIKKLRNKAKAKDKTEKKILEKYKDNPDVIFYFEDKTATKPQYMIAINADIRLALKITADSKDHAMTKVKNDITKLLNENLKDIPKNACEPIIEITEVIAIKKPDGDENWK